jgi:hypothetical protein
LFSHVEESILNGVLGFLLLLFFVLLLLGFQISDDVVNLVVVELLKVVCVFLLRIDRFKNSVNIFKIEFVKLFS